MQAKFPKWFHQVWDIAVATIRAYIDDRCSLWAAALAYYGLFSIFPLILFLIYLGSDVLATGDASAALHRVLSESLPIEITNLDRIITQTLESRGSIGLIGAIGLLWGASAVFNVLEGALSKIWGGKSRPFWGRRLMASASILALSLAFVASLTLGPVISLIFSAFPLPEIEGLSGLLNFGLIVLTSYLLYRIFPNTQVPRWPALVGALFSSLLLVAARFVIDIYLDSAFANSGAVYGSLSWLVYLALWTYIVGTLFLLGAEFSNTLYEMGLLGKAEGAA